MEYLDDTHKFGGYIKPTILEPMKKMASFLVEKYAKMSGDKKIHIAFNLSKTVRQVRQTGNVATGGENIWRPTKQNFLK